MMVSLTIRVDRNHLSAAQSVLAVEEATTTSLPVILFIIVEYQLHLVCSPVLFEDRHNLIFVRIIYNHPDR